MEAQDGITGIDWYFTFEELLGKGKHEEAENMLKGLNIPEGVRVALMSRVQEKQGNYEKAWNMAIQSKTLLRKNKFDYYFPMISQLYALWRLGRFNEALKLYEEVKELVRKWPNIFQARIHNSVGLIYWSLGKEKKTAKEQKKYFELAVEEHLEALRLRTIENREDEQAFSLNNLGNTYLSMADYEKALNFFNQALRIRKELGRALEYATTLRDIGRLWMAQKGPFKAKWYFEKAHEIFKWKGTVNDIAKCALSLAECQLLLRDTHHANKLILEAENYVMDTENGILKKKISELKMLLLNDNSNCKQNTIH